MLEALANLFLAAAVGTALVGFSFLALRNSVATVAVLLAVWIFTAALRDTVELSVLVSSSVRVAALDIASGILLAVGVGRVLSMGVRSLAAGLVLALVLLLGIHVARGVDVYGIQVALNDARLSLYFTATLAYVITVPGGWDNRVWKVLAGAGVLLAAIAVPYWLAGGLGSATSEMVRNGEIVTSRPVQAAGALLILQAAIIASAIGWPTKKAAVYVLFAAAIATLLLQHRTVWAAGLVVAIIGLVWWWLRQNRGNERTVFAVTGVVLLLIPVAVWGFTQTGQLVESASEATRSESTLSWRMSLWDERISANDSVVNLASGEPAGANHFQLINGRATDVSAHNGFVETYLRFGLPGLLVVTWLGLLIWLHRQEIASRTELTAQAVGLLLVTQIVFSVAYSLDLIQGVILGVFVSGLLEGSPVRTAVISRPAPRYATR